MYLKEIRVINMERRYSLESLGLGGIMILKCILRNNSDMERRYSLQSLGLDGMMILKCILRK
jgi:hypothetical protein